MKKLYTIFLFLTLFSACGAGETQINGEIFIVTKGADNIKLGGIEVAAVPEHLMMGSVEGAKPRVEKASNAADEFVNNCISEARKSSSLGDYDAARDALKDCENKSLELLRDLPSPYFDAMPPAVAKATTDANGKFSLKLPTGKKYVLAARGSRGVGQITEKYYWLIKVDAAGDSKQIILSSSNQVGSDSPDSAATIPDSKTKF